MSVTRAPTAHQLPSAHRYQAGAMQNPQVQNVAAMSVQQPQGSQPAPFCGVPGTELAAMAQAAWGQMEGNAQPVPAGHPGPMPEQPSISLSAQAELELELSLRGSLLVQQQRRIVQLEDELQRAWAEIDRLRTKIAAVERERQRSDDDAAKQVRCPPRTRLAHCRRRHRPLHRPPKPRSPHSCGPISLCPSVLRHPAHGGSSVAPALPLSTPSALSEPR